MYFSTWPYGLALLNLIVVAPTSALPSASYNSSPQPPSRSHWTPLPPLLSPRQEQSVTSLDGNIYMVGGTTKASAESIPPPSLDLTESYSVRQRKWTRLAPIPIPINHGNIAAHNGLIYVLGGLTGDALLWSNTSASHTYDPQSNRWTALPGLPAGTARGAAAVGVWREQILLAGGLAHLDLATGSQPSVRTVSAFDTRTQAWSELPVLPEARDHVGGAVVGDVFYVVGGRVNGTVGVKGSVFALDLAVPPAQRAWARKTSMPTPRGGLAAVAVGRKIYTFGGEGDEAKLPNGVYGDVEVYDTKTDCWEKMERMRMPRHGTNAAAVGGRVYIPGGGNVTRAAAVAYFDVFEP